MEAAAPQPPSLLSRWPIADTGGGGRWQGMGFGHDAGAPPRARVNRKATLRLNDRPTWLIPP
jgi:hypothetical protein